MSALKTKGDEHFRKSCGMGQGGRVSNAGGIKMNMTVSEATDFPESGFIQGRRLEVRLPDIIGREESGESEDTLLKGLYK